MNNPPSGNITFLFTDIEGSTRLSQEFPESLQSALDRHHAIVLQAIESNNGFVFENVGDAFCSAFDKSGDALKAAADIQLSLLKAKWKEAVIKVRIGIHTGNAEWTDNRYMGYITLARTARIMSAAHGGQIILSQSVIDNLKEDRQIRFLTRDMGERKLKDLIRPEHLYQLVRDDLPSEFPPLKTLDARQNNLPFQPTSFIGRERELKDIMSLLKENRQVTLLGTGGTGKTRLSIQTGAKVIDEFADGVWFVELAPLSDPLYIPDEIAGVLNLTSDDNRKKTELITSFLKDKEALLIMDNCEHLINGCAETAHLLLSSCTNLKILATSREPLRISGESIYAVMPLPVPDIKYSPETELLSKNEAVRLFAERAASARHDFEINNMNIGKIALLCKCLDGIPLAIELAAARIRVLTVDQITEKINDRFDILTSGSRAALPHHQTLRALIDWSYDLLSEDEKQLFRRLSVFSGGWTIEAAEEVCSDETLKSSAILDLLSNLTDKSLVNTGESGGVSRFSLLETIRHYALEKLQDQRRFHYKHFQYYLKLCRQKYGDKSYDNLLTLRKIKTEFENIRAAINRYINSDPCEALKLMNEVGNAWDLNGNTFEGLEYYRKIFAMDFEADDVILGEAYMNAGCQAVVFSEYELSNEYLSKAIEIFERLNDRSNIGFCLNYIGNIHFSKNEISISRQYHTKGLEIGRELNDKLLTALSLVDLATISRIHNELKTSRGQYEESLQLYRELDDKLAAAQVLTQLASIEALEGNVQKARLCFEESLQVFKEYGNNIPLSITLLNLGNFLYKEKKYDEAELLFEECLSITKQYGYNSIFIHTLIKLSRSFIRKRKYLKAKDLLIQAILKCDIETEKNLLAAGIEGLGNCYFALKKRKEAGLLFGIAESIHKITEFRYSGLNSDYGSALKKIKSTEDEKEFKSFFKKGKKIKLQDAVDMIGRDTLEMLKVKS